MFTAELNNSNIDGLETYIFHLPPLQKPKLQNTELCIALSSWLNGLGSSVYKHLFSRAKDLLPILLVCFKLKKKLQTKILTSSLRYSIEKLVRILIKNRKKKSTIEASKNLAYISSLSIQNFE